MEQLIDFLETSYTPFHAVKNAENFLLKKGFIKLCVNEIFNVERGKFYYIKNGDGCLIAFKVGKRNYFKIVSSHTDSPMFKIKGGIETVKNNSEKLEVESYGGGINYSFFDRPLKVAGRIIVRNDNQIYSKLIESDDNVVIPSVAIHQNREVNKNFSTNVQIDLSPIAEINGNGNYIKNVIDKNLSENEKVLDYDLFVTPAEKAFYSCNNALLSSPRLDNLTSVYSSIVGLTDVNSDGINIVALFNNEEVGSQTNEGAGGTFLKDVIKRIALSLNFSDEDLKISLASSFIVSNDNAHALHPNHPEYSSENSKVYLGKGIVIKHHANQNYTTDGMSSGIFKSILKDNDINYQDFYSRSDMPCGRTLGAISLSEVPAISVDIGIGQLAMHSAVETMAVCDYKDMELAMKAFYNSIIEIKDGKVTIK